MWDLLTIYGKNEIRLLIEDERKYQNKTLIVERGEYYIHQLSNTTYNNIISHFYIWPVHG